MFRPKKVLLLFDDKRNDDPVGNQQSLSFQRPSSELLKRKLEPLLERSPRQEQTTKSQAPQRQGTPDNPQEIDDRSLGLSFQSSPFKQRTLFGSLQQAPPRQLFVNNNLLHL